MKKVAVLAAAMAAVVVISSPASAGSSKANTQITIDFVGDAGGGDFSGEVDSNKGKCFKDRQVKVKTPDDYGNILIGTDDTNDDGEYSVNADSVPPAAYRAIAKKKKIKNNGNVKYVCKKGVSPTISAP